MIQFDLNWLQIVQFVVLPVLLPALVGLVTTTNVNGLGKSLLLLGLSQVGAGLTTLVDVSISGGSFNVGNWLLNGAVVALTAVATHYGFLKPTGVTDRLQAVGVTPRTTNTDVDGNIDLGR